MHHLRSLFTQPVLPHSNGVPPRHVCVFVLRRLFPCVVFLRSQAPCTAVVSHLGVHAYFFYAAIFPAQFFYATKAPAQQWCCVFFYVAIFHAQFFYTASPPIQQWLTTGLCNLNATVCGCRMFCHVFVVPHHPLLAIKIC